MNAWISQVASLFTSMAATCIVGAFVIPMLDGKWPSNPGLWGAAGIALLVAAFLTLNHLSVEDEL